MSVNQTQHRHFDANLSVTKAFPAAGATADTASIDTRSGANALAIAGAGQTVTYVGNAALERVELSINIPALTAHTDNTKKVTAQVFDSADNSSFAAVAELGTVEVPGVAVTGSAATEFRMRLPSTIRRYVLVQFAVTSGGPNVTASSGTVTLYC